MSMEAVSAEEVRRVAELANLELTEEEVPQMQRDLNAILKHVGQMNELETVNVPPMTQVGEMLGAADDKTAVEKTGAALRQDQIRPSVDRKAVMSSAPESDGRFFKVPKVIER